jgi:putative transposase
MVALAVSKRLTAEGLRAAARREPRAKVHARILAIAGLLEGGERGVTARRFGMSRNVLRIWVSRYNQSGVKGLADRHGGGARPRLSGAQQQLLKERVLAEADLKRDGIVAYRILDIRALVAREFGVDYSHGAMHRLLHAIGCSWLMPRPRHPKGDAEAQDEFKKNSRKWSMPLPTNIPTSR